MSAVEGPDHTHGAAPEHVCVYFCGAHIAVAKQLLDGTYVVALLQQASGKAVPERVAAYRFSDIGLAPGAPDRFSQGGVMQMVTSQLSTAWVSPDTCCGEQELPAQFTGGARILSGQSVGHVDLAITVAQVLLMQ